eukprot:1185649-Prorocentrum_minimum.AAC.6
MYKTYNTLYKRTIRRIIRISVFHPAYWPTLPNANPPPGPTGVRPAPSDAGGHYHPTLLIGPLGGGVRGNEGHLGPRVLLVGHHHDVLQGGEELQHARVPQAALHQGGSDIPPPHPLHLPSTVRVPLIAAPGS